MTPPSLRAIRSGDIGMMLLTTIAKAAVVFFILALFEDPVYQAISIAIIFEMYLVFFTLRSRPEVKRK